MTSFQVFIGTLKAFRVINGKKYFLVMPLVMEALKTKSLFCDCAMHKSYFNFVL